MSQSKMLAERGHAMRLLSVEHLWAGTLRGFFSSERTWILKDITFDVHEGEILGIAGLSGAGKSTLVRVVAGLFPFDKGHLVFKEDIIRPKQKRRRMKDMQMLFQDPASALNPRMKIKDSFLEGARLYGVPDFESEGRRIWKELGLQEGLAERYPFQLSGGELQRAALGRVLLVGPKLLILDEPTSMLDASVQAQILRLIREVQRACRLACILISHDLDVLRAVSDRIGILYEGELVEINKTETLFSSPAHPFTKELITAFSDF